MILERRFTVTFCPAEVILRSWWGHTLGSHTEITQGPHWGQTEVTLESHRGHTGVTLESHSEVTP